VRPTKTLIPLVPTNITP
jgi:hypothetical protein